MSNNSFKPELRYGCPAADQILYNRYYTTGYSYYFRQAKWTLEIVDPLSKPIYTIIEDPIERQNNFRPDHRVPERFRASISDYQGSGFDRGHMVASANQDQTRIQNSETYLLSNMCPQQSQFNRNIWCKLEMSVRDLNERKDIAETYVMSGPIFDFLSATNFIGERDNNGIKIPIPTHFFKSVLVERNSGKIDIWTFEMKNEELDGSLADYLVSTKYVEQRAGIDMWSALKGTWVEHEKRRMNNMW